MVLTMGLMSCMDGSGQRKPFMLAQRPGLRKLRPTSLRPTSCDLAGDPAGSGGYHRSEKIGVQVKMHENAGGVTQGDGRHVRAMP